MPCVTPSNRPKVPLWQTVYVGDLFAGYSYDYEVERVDVLGVSVPLELGEQVRRFVDAAFGLFFSVGFAGLFIWVFVTAHARRQPNVKAGALGWIFGLIIQCRVRGLEFMAGFALPACGLASALLTNKS